jgi:drug/metabolite transporter (DMT)-like permease
MVTLFAPQVSSFSLSDSILYGSLLAVTSALLASFGNMVSQRAQRLRLPVIQSNAWGMFYGALLTAVYSVANGYQFVFEWTIAYGISLAYLTVFGSIVGFGAYLTLLGRIGAHRAGYAMVMFPVVALILSLLFEGMRLSWSIVIGTALVLAGNVFILRNPPSKLPKSSTLDTWNPEPGAAVSGKIQS